MAYTEKELKKELDNKSYEFGFVTDIESEKAPNGLNEDIIRLIIVKSFLHNHKFYQRLGY